MVHRQKELDQLELQKRWLAAECDLQRLTLALQLTQAQAGDGWFSPGYLWQKHWRVLLPGMVAGGFLLTRRRVRGWLMKAVLGWTLWRRVRPLRVLLGFLLKGRWRGWR